MKMSFVCAALATLVASPALAQAGFGPFVPDNPYPYPAYSPYPFAAYSPNPYAAYGAVTPYGVPGSARKTGTMSSARAAAIHRCSTATSKYTEHTWGDEEFQQYKACMAMNGQPE
jgi:hypothetical protein